MSAVSPYFKRSMISLYRPLYILVVIDQTYCSSYLGHRVAYTVRTQHEQTTRNDTPAMNADLDAVVSVVEKLTAANATQYRINAIVDHVVSTDWRQRIALHQQSSIHRSTSVYKPSS